MVESRWFAQRHRLWLVVLCLLLVGALLPPPASAQSPVDGKATSGDPYFPGLGNGGYDVRQYDIALRIDPKRKVMNGTTTITLTPTVPLRSFTFDFIGFEVTDVTVDGVAARSKRERDGYKLRITPAQPLAAGTAVAVAVTYRGKPDNPRKDTGWAWFKNGGALFDPQPSGARTVFPCNDYPADKATFRYELTTPRGLPGIANGLPSAVTVADGWETVTWTEANPFPTYAALVAVGNFTLEETVGPTGVPILNALPVKHANRLSQRVRRQGQMVEVLTAYLGPYPYGSIGAIVLPRANPSAMEAATRPTYPGIRWALKGKSFEQVVAHEVAHMWLGNTVTNTNWRDIWLNEGFATYGELIWIAETRDVPIAKLFARNSRVFSYGNDLETVKPGNPGGPRIFNTSVYNRGALTLEALRRTVGNDDFYAILREWVARYGGGNATTRDFIALSEEISGQQLDRLFERWLYGNGLPKLPKPPGVSGDALLTAAELERLDGLLPVGPEKGPAAAPREAPAERRAAPRGGRD